jgi:alkylation response protein AidB-like acyl-CoA dehydrogenase
MTGTLDHERATRITNAGAIRRGVEEFVEYAKATKGPDGRALAEDPILADKLAQLAIDAEIARLLAYRTVTVMLYGGNPDKESSSLKLWCSELAQRLAHTGVHMLGPAGLISSEGTRIPFDGRVASHLLLSYSQTMGSGTSEVQRNIIATRGLGMPR